MAAELGFEDLRFIEEKDRIIARFYDIFYFEIDKSTLSLHEFRIKEHSIIFSELNEAEARLFFNKIIDSGMSRLKNSINGRSAIFLHKGMEIPLLGTNFIGIVVRNSSLVEIKPISGCNLNCMYCSLSEGKSENLALDYVIEPSFLCDELKKVLDMLECEEFEIHIGCQGEPMLYSKLKELIMSISGLKKVKSISMDTNGTLLSRKKVDELIDAGLGSFNLSLDSLDQEKATKIADAPYDLAHVLEMAEYIASKRKLLLAPLLLPGVNDSEMPKLIRLAKKLKARIGIQNFLSYRHGRKPVKGINMKEFYSILSNWENQEDCKLILSAEDFGVRKIKPLKKPFFKGNIIECEILFPGRHPGETVCRCGGRLVAVTGASRNKGRIKAKITRDKHNIFYGEAV
jgi:hypothetical protein